MDFVKEKNGLMTTVKQPGHSLGSTSFASLDALFLKA
jgi:hypothetical protein